MLASGNTAAEVTLVALPLMRGLLRVTLVDNTINKGAVDLVFTAESPADGIHSGLDFIDNLGRHLYSTMSADGDGRVQWNVAAGKYDLLNNMHHGIEWCTEKSHVGLPEGTHYWVRPGDRFSMDQTLQMHLTLRHDLTPIQKGDAER